MKFTKPFAELLGTFLLTLSVALSVHAVGGSMVPTGVIAGLVLAICVYTIGSLSGCHINPAVTLALASGGKVNNETTIHYIIAQCLGGILASIVFALLLSQNINFAPVAAFDVSLFFTELIGAFFFVFGISAVVWGKVHDAMHGLVIGSSLLIGIMLAVHAGGVGILNPAVALGLAKLNFATLLGPIVGGILAVKVYKAMVK